MDETTFHDARRKVDAEPCVFQRALLARHCACALAVRLAIGERETIGCRAVTARQRCARLLALLREKAVFALHLTHADKLLPHAKLMKLECGGLAGVQKAVDGREAVDDVHTLLMAARDRFGDLAELPYPLIMQAVVHFEPRPRRTPSRS